MRKDKHEKSMKGCGETAAMTLLNDSPAKGGSKVSATLVVDAVGTAPQENIRHHVEPGSAVRTDQLVSYVELDPGSVHGVVNHADRYVDGIVPMNGCENFSTLLRRMIKGTHVSVVSFRLFGYRNNQLFPFRNGNAEAETDGVCVCHGLRTVIENRLMHLELTGMANLEELLN